MRSTYLVAHTLQLVAIAYIEQVIDQSTTAVVQQTISFQTVNIPHQVILQMLRVMILCISEAVALTILGFGEHVLIVVAEEIPLLNITTNLPAHRGDVTVVRSLHRYEISNVHIVCQFLSELSTANSRWPVTKVITMAYNLATRKRLLG